MKTIGSIGLGAMGGSYAKFLIEDNYTVYGVDPDTQNAEIFTSLGGILLNNISDLIDKSEVIILSLPTVPIFKQVINEIEVNGKSNEFEYSIQQSTTFFVIGPKKNLQLLINSIYLLYYLLYLNVYKKKYIFITL